MTQSQDRYIATLEEQVTQLEKELLGTQQILGFVLQSVGKPVLVSDEAVTAGLPDGLAISIERDLAKSCHIVSLTKEPVENQP